MHLLAFKNVYPVVFIIPAPLKGGTTVSSRGIPLGFKLTETGSQARYKSRSSMTALQPTINRERVSRQLYSEYKNGTCKILVDPVQSLVDFTGGGFVW